MKRTPQSAILAGLLAALALAACSSTPSGYSNDRMGANAPASPVSSSAGSAAPVGSTSGATTGNMGTEGTTAGSMTPTPDPMGSGKMQGMMMAPNALVLTIESMPRQSGIAASGAAVGSSGSAGTSGSSMADDRVYRITLRMDDGSTRVVTQERSPAFSIGERVNMSDGAISTVP